MERSDDKNNIQSQLDLFETALESLPFPFHVIDPKTYKILLGNPKGEDPVGKACYEVDHKRSEPCDGRDHPCGLRQVLEEKKSVTTEHIHYDDQGNPRNVEVHMHPVFDDDGQVERVIEYCNDITERKKREREQDHMAMELYAIYENIPFFLCVIDENRRVVHANQFLAQLTGMTNDELFSESMGTAFGCIKKSFEPDICGLGEDCTHCPLRIAVDDTFKTGVSHRDIEKRISITKGGKTKNIILSGSTSLIQRYGNDRLMLCLQDITKQRENESLLRVLSKAVSQSPVTVVITDIHGMVEYTNPKFTETTGYTAQEVLGQKTSILKGPDKTKEEYRELWETILSGNNWAGTFHNRRKDGSLYWESAIISPVKDKNGEIQNFFAVKEDITERRQMEEQLRLQARAIEDSTSAVVIADACRPDNPIIYVNPAFERTTGYSSRDIIGRNCRFLQGKDRNQPGLDAIREGIKQGKPCHALLRNYRKDGTRFWNDLRISPLQDTGGRVTHYVGISDDVTQLKDVQGKMLLNERRLRLSQEYAHIGTWDWDIRTGELSWSEIVPTMFGLPKGQTRTTLEDFVKLIHPEDRMPVEKAIKESLDNNIDYHIEHRCIRPDGTIRWMQEDGNISRDEDGSPLHMLGVVQDITERKLQEEEILLSREEATRANQAKSDFLSAMSHELRTPMNAIMGFGQLLELDENLDSEQKDYVQEIRKAGSHLLDLINEVLDLSRVETGRVDLSLETISCNELIKECHTLLNPLAVKKDITIKPEYDPEAYLFADRLRLKQVLVNLLTNAIKYNNTGGHIWIRVSRHNSVVRISVADNGPGIPAERMPGLFEPFNRLGAEMKEIEGTGIGLTISKKLVELMGGAIGVESKAGIGSTFWIDIPTTEKPVETESSARGSSPVIEDTGPTKSKILYIEDNPSNLRLVEQILGRYDNITLYTAHTPSIGLELAEGHRPELILLDLNLPEMDGFAVLEKLRRQEWGADIPVVAISANAMARDIERGREAGFTDYLTKPLDIQNFLKVVFQLLDKESEEAVP